MSEILLAITLGFSAGILSGMFGVGGGILFIPTLVIVLDLTQLSAQATALAAMVPVVLVGALLQNRYGNVRWNVVLIVGLASAVGVAGGAALADSLPDDVLRKLFAGLLLVVAAHLAWTHGRRPRDRDETVPG